MRHCLFLMPYGVGENRALPAQAVGKRTQSLIKARRIFPETCVSGIGDTINLRVWNRCPMLIDGSYVNDRIRHSVRKQDGLAYLRQEIIIIDGAGKQRLAYMRRNGDAVPQHQVNILWRGWMSKEHAHQRFEAADAFFGTGGEERGDEAQQFRRDHGQRGLAAQFRNSSDKMHATDVVLATVPNIVEDDQRAIRPTTQDRVIELECVDDGVDVVRP